jgi:hypothetical protein
MNSYPALKATIYVLYVVAVLAGIGFIIMAFDAAQFGEMLHLPSGFAVFLLLFIGGLTVLLCIARAEMIRVYLDLDETVNDQLEMQEETNKLLSAIVKAQTPAEELPQTDDWELRKIIIELSKLISEDTLLKLHPHQLHRVKKLLDSMSSGDAIVWHDNAIKLIEKDRYAKMKEEGVSDRFTIIYEK